MGEAKQMHQDVSVGKKTWSSGTDQDATPGEMVRRKRLKLAKALFKKSLIVLAHYRHHLSMTYVSANGEILAESAATPSLGATPNVVILTPL
jgi:hypothetical protein